MRRTLLTGTALARLTLPVVAVVCLAAMAGGPQGAPGPASASAIPTITDAEATGHRLWIMLFDVSSMEQSEIALARNSATVWVNTSMGPPDVVSIVTIGSSLTLVQNFTGKPDAVKAALDKILPTQDFTSPPRSGTADTAEEDVFNNDLRMRGLHDLCTGLKSIGPKKVILFFTTPRERPGRDNQVEVHAATEACLQANATINPVDIGG